MSKTQSKRILVHLQSGRCLTPLAALRLFDCFRLGARVYDLKKEGHKIEKEMVEVTGRDGRPKHVAQYSMEAEV